MDEIENQKQKLTTSPSPLKDFLAIVWDLAVIFVIVFVIIAPFRIFIAEPFVVSGSSMVPNFHDRDYLIVDRITYRTHAPERGDVVVLKYPKDTSQYFIKRIIGLPGETVIFQQGHTIIKNSQYPDGFTLTEPYLTSPVETIGKIEPTVLGSEEYFVMGDNRTASSDSRVWGVLPKKDIIGRVWVRVFPFSSSGFIDRVNYK